METIYVYYVLQIFGNKVNTISVDFAICFCDIEIIAKIADKKIIAKIQRIRLSLSYKFNDILCSFICIRIKS